MPKLMQGNMRNYYFWISSSPSYCSVYCVSGSYDVWRFPGVYGAPGVCGAPDVCGTPGACMWCLCVPGACGAPDANLTTGATLWKHFIILYCQLYYHE